ncbi:MAG: toprim domain-containing protein [Candidatus Micrarchaeota archaeon]|nr:toprim domain-containing protein [Candidatus Micrarchaeota archaeon]
MKKFSPMALRKLQKKQKLLDRTLKDLAESGAAVLVEGKRDREALQRIGVRNRIFLVNMSPDKLCLRVSKVAGEAVILTDFDEAGQKLCRRIEEALHSYNVLPNTEVRRKLRYLLGVYNFEDIDRRMEEFKNKIEGDMDG